MKIWISFKWILIEDIGLSGPEVILDDCEFLLFVFEL